MSNSHSSLFKVRSTTRGFSLVEMIVALGIFSIVAVVALGALVKIIDANKKAQTLQAAITNLNFALESMSREMRVGSTYRCDSNVPGGGYDGGSLIPDGCDVDDNYKVIAFISSKVDADCPTPDNNLAFAYRFDDSTSVIKLQKAQQTDCDDPIESGDFSDIVDPNVIVESYGIQVSEDTYPMAVVRISGYAGVREREKTLFDVQTAVSARAPSFITP